MRSLNLVGLKRMGLSTEEIKELKKAFRHLYRSGNTLEKAIQELDFGVNNPYIQHLTKFLRLSISDEGRRGPIPGK